MIQAPLSEKVYALVDCDSFFVSCELIRNPIYRGREVAVGHDIVLAASYEAKAKGVTTGTPFWEAKKLIPGIVLIASDHNYYGHISKKVMALLKTFALETQVYSIDEAFLDITGQHLVHGFADYQSYIEHIQQTVHQYVGIPVSIGAAPTKLIAKILAKKSKPFGTYAALDMNIIDKYFAGVSIRKVPFIGRKTYNKLQYSVKSILDFKNTSVSLIQQTLNGPGVKIWFELHGVDVMNFAHSKQQSSISRGRSFNPFFTDKKEVLWGYLVGHFESVYAELCREKQQMKGLGVFMRTKEFKTHRYSADLANFTDDRTLLLTELKKVFEGAYQTGTLYRSTGIVLYNLQSNNNLQGTLFDYEKDNRRKIIQATIDSINAKFHRKVITNAASICK